MSTEAQTSKAHANQLGRVLGILDAMAEDVAGNELVVVKDVRDACENRAERIAYDVERQAFGSLDAAEYRTLATFCDQMATRGLVRKPHSRKRAKTLAEIAGERAEGVQDD